MQATSKPEVTIATDGSCSPNPGPGGWSALFRMGGHSKVIYGYDPSATNIRMEMTACIRALNHLHRPCNIVLYSDSQFTINGITKWVHRWRRNNWMTAPFSNNPAKAVANKDLWEELLKAVERHRIQWEWVKGHATHGDNIICDRYAEMARLNMVNGEEILTNPSTTDGFVSAVRHIEFL